MIPETFLLRLLVFVLAGLLGFELIRKVPAKLHTPLMSGSNAISGITLLGALTAVGAESLGPWRLVLGLAAVVLATINVVGGYVVTDRMLRSFRPKGRP